MRRPNSRGGLRLVFALAGLLAAGAVAHAYFLISPLSFWPASSVSGNLVFEVALVPGLPNVPVPPLTDGSASWDAAFVAQLDAWNAVLPDAVLNLQGNVGSAAAQGAGNGINNVHFSADIYGEAWGGNTLGICLASWSGNERTEADVLFNSTKPWNAYTGPVLAGQNDFRRVALHELGHALLLDHPDDAGQSVSAIMNSLVSNIDALTADDIAGVTAVFGALTPITITRQPQPVSTSNGANASFSVAVAGSEPLTYDWQQSTNGGGAWTSLGIDAAAFSFGPMDSGDNGNLFRVIVTNPVGAVTSNAIPLTVTASAIAPDVTTDPVNTTAFEFTDAIFSVGASGSPTPSIQWQFSQNAGVDWNPVPSAFGGADFFGGTTPVLKITRVSGMNNWQFRAVATNSAGNDTSAAATLTVNGSGNPSFFRWQPLDVAATTGSDVSFIAGVGGVPTPVVQWRRSIDGGDSWANLDNDATFSGVTSATLAINDVSPAMSGHLFQLLATNSAGNATSRVAALSVGTAASAPTVLVDPDGISVALGADISFRTVVSGLPAPVYQWQFSTDGVNFNALSDGFFVVGSTTIASLVSGANTRTLAIADVAAPLNGYDFRLVATNASGTDTSAVATLIVDDVTSAPIISDQPDNTTRSLGEHAAFTVAATGTPTPTGFQWQRSTNGGGAWNDVNDDATFAGASSATLTVNDLTLAMDDHQFRVVVSNGVSPDATSIAAALTVELPPPPGPPATPTGIETSFNSFSAQWTAVAGASGYRVDVATDAGFTSFVAGYQNLDLGNVTSLNVSSLGIGSYHVRIRAYNGGGTSTSSGTFALAIGGAFVNLSTRGETSPANPMIVGFFVSGATKTVLIRVAANILAAPPFNLAGTLPDPRLRVVNQSTQQDIAINDDWDASDPDLAAAIIASGAGLIFAPGSKDSALVLDLPPGGYTALVESVTGASGIVLTELYAVDDVGRFVNISTRGFTVDAGGSVMIPGTFFDGQSKRVLIRVVGQTLGILSPGVPNVLQDPILEVYDDSGDAPIYTNDNWSTETNAADIAATTTPGDPLYTGAFALGNGSLDAAVLLVLPGGSGGYTVHAKGKAGATGTVLVEFYEVP